MFLQLTGELLFSRYGWVRDPPEESKVFNARFRLSLCARLVSLGLASVPEGPGVPGIKAVSAVVRVSCWVSWFDPVEWQEVRLATTTHMVRKRKDFTMIFSCLGKLSYQIYQLANSNSCRIYAPAFQGAGLLEHISDSFFVCMYW